MASKMMDIGIVAVTGGEDLAVAGGDFTNAESTAWHQKELILNDTGEFKENPTICVGAFDYLDDENFNDLIRAIGQQFSLDGMQVNSVALNPDGTIRSDAYYP